MSYHLSFLPNDAHGADGWYERALRMLNEVPEVSVRSKNDSLKVFTYRRKDDSEIDVFFSNGNLWANRIVDTAVISDLARLADEIGAQLVGDEGEIYMPDGSVVPANAVSVSQRIKWFARRNWFNIILFASIAIVIAYLRLA